MVAATSTVPFGVCTTPTVSTVYNPSSPRYIVRSRPMLVLPRNVSLPSWILLAMAHLRVLGEGEAGTLDRAVPIVLDIVLVGSRAICADHARAGPDETRVLVVDQLTDQFPHLLQFAGEAGDLILRRALFPLQRHLRRPRGALDALAAEHSPARHADDHSFAERADDFI